MLLPHAYVIILTFPMRHHISGRNRAIWPTKGRKNVLNVLRRNAAPLIFKSNFADVTICFGAHAERPAVFRHRLQRIVDQIGLRRPSSFS